MTADVSDPLASSRLFGKLTQKDRIRLAREMTERTFAAGTDVLTAGDGGVGFYTLIEGEAVVFAGDGHRIRTLRPGDSFGELSVIDGGTRAANVTAQTDIRVLMLTAWNFRALVKKDAEMCWTLLVELAGNLREAQARASMQ